MVKSIAERTCTERSPVEERKRRGEGENGTDEEGNRHGDRGKQCSHVMRFIELDCVVLV